jgi:hypothetical protein
MSQSCYRRSAGLDKEGAGRAALEHTDGDGQLGDDVPNQGQLLPCCRRRCWMPTRRFWVRGILIATGNLTVTYKKQRQLDKAAVRHETVLDMNQTVLGEWHPDTVELGGDVLETRAAGQGVRD